VSERMSRGCCEKTGPVEFKLEPAASAHIHLEGNGGSVSEYLKKHCNDRKIKLNEHI